MRRPTVGTIDTTGQTSLANPMSDRVCTYLIQFESDSFSGSVTIKGAALDSNYTLTALAYKSMNTGVNTTTAITGNALVLVDAAGVNVVLDATVTSGELRFTAVPLIG